ncbi:unnamed protein product [Strongylus vulgaris]|uniref:Uncharacterized protein n=1 Tax=Strongylus vulgaris TaxID=40348 RepID=A0A3P7JCY1_STRVU|nr:unnamed protein product [Strongylus vulgaris]
MAMASISSLSCPSPDTSSCLLNDRFAPQILFINDSVPRCGHVPISSLHRMAAPSGHIFFFTILPPQAHGVVIDCLSALLPSLLELPPVVLLASSYASYVY